jgi:hypothetical protein
VGKHTKYKNYRNNKDLKWISPNNRVGKIGISKL